MADQLYDCEQCAAAIPYRPGQRTVLCPKCGAEQKWPPLEAAPTEAPRPSESPTTNGDRRERIVPIPEKLGLHDDGHRMTIRRRWFTPSVLFMVFFCVAWDSFLVFWYSMAFGDRNAPWLMVIFPIGHVAVGVGLTYATLAGLFNSTTIRVQRDELSVAHGPLPWRGNRTVRTRQIEQLYCKEGKTYSNNNGPTHSSYEVYAVLDNRRQVKLVAGGLSAEEALAIEQALEQRLGIDDQPVAGEMSV